MGVENAVGTVMPISSSTSNVLAGVSAPSEVLAESDTFATPATDGADAVEEATQDGALRSRSD